MRNALTPTRAVFIPMNAVLRSDDLSDAVAYVSDRDTPDGWRWRAVIFVGKQSRPVSYYTFRTEAARDAEITKQFEGRRKALSYKEERRRECKSTGNPFVAGDVLYSGWGATMWFIDFFEVISSKGKTLVIRPIRGDKKATHYDGGLVTPVPGNFRGEERKVRVVGGRAKVSDHYATLAPFKEIDGVKVYDSHGYTDVD